MVYNLLNRSDLQKLIVFSLTLAIALNVNAQQPSKILLLEEAIQKAISDNRQVAVAKTEESIANANYQQTNAIWLPQVNLSQMGYSTNNPLNAFGFKLQQASVMQTDFNPMLLNNPGATSNYTSQVMLQQPLLNLDMLYMRKAAKQQIELFTNQTKRTKEAIKMQVVQAYLFLELSYKVEAVTKQGLETINSIYKFTNDRYAQGMLQKSDLLNVEVQVKLSEVQHNQSVSQIATISDQLSALMHSPLGIIYELAPYKLANSENLPLEVSLLRADIKAMNAAISSYDLAIKSTKMAWLPKLNSFANYQINDKSINFNGPNSYLAGVQLSWDIFKGNQNKYKVNTQLLEKNKVQVQLESQLESGALEIRKTKRTIQDANYKIAQQLKAVEQSEEALRIIQNRYTQGLVNTNDVLVAQTQVSSQQLQYAQAIFEQKSAVNYLDFLTTK
jgi:outer membrane protein TolC